MKFLVIALSMLFIFKSCYCQINKKQMYVIRVSYIPINVEFDGNSSVYTIIDDSTINKLPNFLDTNITPGIVYLITKFGGYYAADDSTNIVSRVCCLTGDIKGTLKEYLYQLYINKLNTFDNELDEIKNLFYDLKVRKRNSLIVKKNVSRKYENKDYKAQDLYKISFWRVNVEYCICDIYSTTIFQRTYGNKCAYIRGVGRPLRMEKAEIQKIKNKFKLIIAGMN